MKQFWCITLSSLAHYIELSVAFMCTSHIGAERYTSDWALLTEKCWKKAPQRVDMWWVTLMTTPVQMIFSTKLRHSVLSCIYHVCCHNLIFCFNAMDSTEMMHILWWHVLLPNTCNRPFLGKIHAIHCIRHSILVRSIALNVFQR